MHTNYIGHPVVNDDKYGDFTLNKEFSQKYKYKYQLLHSYQISFTNIKGALNYLNNKTFTAPLKDNQKLILQDIFNELRIDEI